MYHFYLSSLWADVYLQQLHKLLLLSSLSQFVSSVHHLVLKSPPAAAQLRHLSADVGAVLTIFTQHFLTQLENTHMETVCIFLKLKYLLTQ